MQKTQTKTCKSCMSEIHIDANICPYCREKQKTGNILKIFFIFIAVMTLVNVIDKDNNLLQKNTKTLEQIEHEKIEEAAFQADILKIKALKYSMKNPNSFEFISAIRIEKTKVLCVEYRGTNSFNALIIERQAISSNLKFIDWNVNCAGKSGKDMEIIKHAL